MKQINLVLTLLLCLGLYSCNQSSSTGNTNATQAPLSSENQNNTSQMPQISAGNIEVKTFEVKDSSDKVQGWGYDIYTNGKKVIHQPIVPGIAGNNYFKTEEDARKTGLLAANKMRTTGSLPTLSPKELDSLGVINK